LPYLGCASRTPCVAQPVGISHPSCLEISPGNQILFVANLPWTTELVIAAIPPCCIPFSHNPCNKIHRKSLNERSLPLLLPLLDISTSLPHFLRLENSFNVQTKLLLLHHDVSLSVSVPIITLTIADRAWSHFFMLNFDRNASEAD